MTDSLLPISAPIQTPTSAREALVDRFLARVAALSPRQWGELDAIGQRFTASDPVAVWERAQLFAAFAGRAPVLEDVLTLVGFVGFGVAELFTIGRRRKFRVDLPNGRLTRRPDATPETRALLDRIETLMDVASHQAGGPRESTLALGLALAALWTRDHMPAAAFARIYALTEPVIPFASL